MKESGFCAGRKKEKRGQIAIELFLVLAIFSLSLAWFNNYMQQIQGEDLLFSQQKNLLNQISLLAGESFALNESVSFQMPCFTVEGKSTPYWLYASGQNVTLLAVLYGKNQSVGVPFSVTVASPSNPLRFVCSNGENAGVLLFDRSADVVELRQG